MVLRKTSFRWLACALAVGLLASLAPAQYTWDGDADPIWDWEEDTNWVGDVAPLWNDYADVIFGTGGSGADMLDSFRLNDITFNRAGDFQILANTQYFWPAPRELELYGDITVTQAYTYRISARGYRVMLMADNTIDVVAGGTMLFDTAATYSQQICTYGDTITKTGAGTLEFTGNENVSGLYGLGAFNLQAGDVKVTTTGSSTVEGIGGTGGTFTAKGNITIDQINPTDLETTAVFNGGMTKENTAQMTVSGASGVLQLGLDTLLAVRGGTLQLDNTAVNRNDRMELIGTGTNFRLNLNSGKLELIGNATVGSSESCGADVSVYTGLGQIAVTHGASASATITVGGITNGGSPAMLLMSGNDLAAASGPGSYIMASGTSGVVLDDGIIGGWALVGDEFAGYDATLGVNPLSASHASRTGAVATATGDQNVLVTSAQAALTGNVTINSLKIDGAYGLDLGGNTLTIGSGGLIQVGADNNGIDNGTLTSATGRIYANTAKDLAIGALLTGSSITKIGAGKLTLGDASLLEGVNLADGSLDVTNNAAMNVIVANSQKAGTLTKAGTGTMVVNRATSADALIGDVYVNSGTVQFGHAHVFAATSTVHVIGDGVLQATYASNWFGNPAGWVSLESGGRYVFYDSTNGYTAHLKLTVLDEGEIYNPGTGERHVDTLSGAGRLIKFGTNDVCFSDFGSSHYDGFTGTIDVAEGTLRIFAGRHPENAAGYHVRSGATLHWNGWGNTLENFLFSGDGTIVDTRGTFPTFRIRASTVSPGASVGTLAITGALSFSATDPDTKCILDIEATDSSTVDVLAVTGTVGGLDNCDVLFDLPAPSKANFDIITGVNLTFLTTSSISGSFSAVSTVATNVGSHYSLVVGDIITDVPTGTGTATMPGTAAVLMLTGTHWTGHDGDTNLDDDVDVLDLANMANNFGRGITDPGVSWLTSDYNIDGEVDVLDLAKMANNFGWSSGAGGEAVPEPFTVAILAVGAVAIIRRRRR